MSGRDARQREFTGRHMLIVMVAFFGVVIAVNAALAYFAAESWTGLLARNGYVASQDYNRVLADARRQAELGWRSRIEAGRDGLVLTVTGGAGEALTGLDVTARIERPTHADEDRAVTLRPLGAGRYGADLALAPGAWTVRVAARNRAGEIYRRIFDVRVAKGG